ncbi:RHS repeat-associated core domain-containing protein [Treponema denticola ATCC 33520]|uniref:RHS repeat domain-containing protein n=1 Tax=Treponema denticola TaxID=158 RepID=UPI0002B5A574|nr:RHS repeat-associated core domain-containing protein [Treponema denticola]EMB39717.1 RHS repeat-associated core domain-containing protein [Treponema denticola ATCC 33520]
MKTKLYLYLQPNYLFSRTAIEAEILFAVCLSKKQALTGGKSLACEDKYSKKIGAKSAVLTLVYFYIIMIVHKCQQSAAQSCSRTFELRVLPFGKTSGAKLLNFVSCPLSEVFPLTVGSGKTMAFENRRGKYKELGKKVPQAYRVYVEDAFLPCDAVIARIFSKEMTHTDNQGDNEEQKVKRYYYHSDHLGSAQFITDWKGRQYEHIEYTPYGELWIEEVAAGLDKLPFRFTGKELDEETGLYYYGARYLDPKYSRWLSGDPALSDYIPKAPIDDDAKKHNENLPGMGGVFNVVNLHVYHYAGNNPVKYTDPDGRVSCGTEVILRIDGYLDKNNAFGMAKILYQYSKNPSEGALSSIATAGVGFFGVAPAIASSLVSLVLALSNDKKNQINDLAFSIMTAVSEYGDLLDSGEYSIHVSGTMTTKNTIEFFRRKDEQLSNITTFSSDLNFTLVDKDGKEIKHLGKYTADPSAIKELLDKYSEKPIKVIEFNGGLPIKVERLE